MGAEEREEEEADKEEEEEEEVGVEGIMEVLPSFSSFDTDAAPPLLHKKKLMIEAHMEEKQEVLAVAVPLP